MKRLLEVSAVAVCVLVCFGGLQAAPGLENEAAVVRSGRAFVPLRAVFEWLGADVHYANGTITAVRGGDVVTLTVGSTQAGKNGHAITLDAAPFVTGGKSFVPLRFVAEALGAAVNYSAAQGNVTVSHAGAQVTLPVFAYRPGWLPYRGAWFKIDHPASFTVVNRERSASGQGYEAASFVSPDGLVEFYVFSPQWRGESQWVKPRAGEREIARSVENNGDRTATYVTYAGPGGAYERAYVEMRDAMSNTNWFFGIQYKSKSAYDRYRSLYLQFKASLVQYAD